MNIIKYKKIFFAFSGLLAALSLVSVIVFGLTFGIEFTGGTLVESSFESDRPSKEEMLLGIEAVLPELRYSLQETGETGYVMRSEFLDEGSQSLVLDVFEDASASI